MTQSATTAADNGESRSVAGGVVAFQTLPVVVASSVSISATAASINAES